MNELKTGAAAPEPPGKVYLRYGEMVDFLGTWGVARSRAQRLIRDGVVARRTFGGGGPRSGYYSWRQAEEALGLERMNDEG